MEEKLLRDLPRSTGVGGGGYLWTERGGREVRLLATERYEPVAVWS